MTKRPETPDDEPSGQEGHLTNHVAETHTETIWSRFQDSDLPSLPKMAAVQRAYKACAEYGLPDGFAAALAQAAVDPAELRALLGRPTRVNVAGGIIEAIDLDLYVPGVVPLPTNNRTMERRVYPAAGAAGFSGPLAGPRSAAGQCSTLWIEGDDVGHVLDEIKRSQDYILVKNNLKESIAARGIAMPVTVTYFELRHRDGQPAMPLLGTADGSSRITNAQDILGLKNPKSTHYDFPTTPDSYRRFIGSISEADASEMGGAARRRLDQQRNALITPARVFLRFTPSGGGYDYARAINAYVGLLHVDPPKPWSPTGKLEAMAEAVLQVLREAQVVDDNIHDFLAGLLSPAEAAAAGLPTERDSQAAFVLATLLQPQHREMVDRGIRDVTAKKSVSVGRRTDVVAELALRPTRSESITLPPNSAGRIRAEQMRAAYLRSSQLAGYAKCPWSITGREPEELLRASLEELNRSEVEQANPAAWSSRLELAALAQYHLTAWGSLAREPMGDSNADKRGPQSILQLMIEDEMGLRLLAQAIRDGRAGREIRRLDEDGQLILGYRDEEGNWHKDPKGSPMPITDQWLRYEAYSARNPLPRPVVPPQETASMKATRLQKWSEDLVEQLAASLEELATVEGPAGGSLLDQEGWPAPQNILNALMSAQSQIGYWARVAERHATRTNEEVLAQQEEFDLEAEEDEGEMTQYNDAL